MTFDVVLEGGRVLDPETGLDAIRDVGVSAGTVTVVAAGPLPQARLRLEVSGFVVAPGFIDLHSHSPGIPELRLQALDGVTTALDLEAGAGPISRAYERAAAEGRPVNYGFSASWAAARMEVLAGIRTEGKQHAILDNIGHPEWQRAASRQEIDRIVATVSADLAGGALGIGILLGYGPGTGSEEYLAMARLAAAAGCVTFTHARSLVEDRGDAGGGPSIGVVDGAEEIVMAAAETGAPTHMCHVNSVASRHVDRVLALVDRARSEGARVSTEAYPYGFAMTGIGAAFLDPDALARRGRTPDSLVHLRSGERVRDAEHLRRLRASDPGGLVVDEHLREDDPRDRGFLLRALCFPDTVIASDAMPLVWTAPPPDPMRWPLPPGGLTHPRTAGTYARSIRMLTRDDADLGLVEVMRRCSLLPALLLEEMAPAMRRKGRVQVGCDADLAVFDPETITDRASYANSSLPSVGMRHVMVGGTLVVRDGDVVPDALPGVPVRAVPR
ncbi:amidohydrolase family protein [Jiangella asiatica]|uniref:D-glutamate deacylase n=1 Tax=Jiangella asiatica TaxID=2530372 RepID=A0A4R5D571_9ACTN|nr:amidohydrolase family protein [Jiangella asiatica]TDE08466.1 D-glutamate deacylase [Jiangella asiatica]